MLETGNSEVIALVLPSGAKEAAAALKDFVGIDTMLLIRQPDGRMSLESTRHEAARADHAGNHQSHSIHDSDSCEVLGHQLEMITRTLLC